MNQHTPKNLYPLKDGSLRDYSQKKKDQGKQGKPGSHSVAGVNKTNPACTINISQLPLHFLFYLAIQLTIPLYAATITVTVTVTVTALMREQNSVTILRNKLYTWTNGSYITQMLFSPVYKIIRSRHAHLHADATVQTRAPLFISLIL